MSKQIILFMSLGILLFSCKTKKVKETEMPKEPTVELSTKKEIDLNQIAGDYYVTAMVGVAEFNEVLPTIKIDESGKISGFNGCNSFFGQLNMEKGPLLENLGSTRKACDGEGSDVERMMMETLREISNITFDGQLIKFFAGDNAVIEGKSLSLEEGNWQVTSIVGVNADQLPTFEINNDRMTGHTGCNSFFGMTEQKGCKLKFIEVGSTEMVCEGFDMTMESKFIAALSSVTEFKIEGEILIFSKMGEELFRAANPDK